MKDCNNYPDFEADKILEDEQHNLLCYSWYGDELIGNRSPRYTQQEQINILNTHPFFTGLCLKCGYKFIIRIIILSAIVVLLVVKISD